MKKLEMEKVRIGVVAEFLETGRLYAVTEVAEDKSSATLTEILTEEEEADGRTAKVVVANANNRVMFGFVKDPNPKDTPKAELVGGVLYIDGKEVETGELVLTELLANVPGGALVVSKLENDRNDRYDVLRYDLSRDRFDTVVSNIPYPSVMFPGDGYALLYYDEYETVKVPDEDGKETDVRSYVGSAVILLSNGMWMTKVISDQPLGEFYKELLGNDGKDILVFRSGEALAPETINEVVVNPTKDIPDEVILTKFVLDKEADYDGNLLDEPVILPKVSDKITSVTVARGNRILVKTESSVLYSNDGRSPKLISSKADKKSAEAMRQLQGYNILTNYDSSDGRVTLYLRNDENEVKAVTSKKTEKGIVLEVFDPADVA